MIYYVKFQSMLGQMFGVSDGSKLTGLYFDNHVAPPMIEPDWILDPTIEVFSLLQHQLLSYFLGERRTFDLPLKLAGTNFQEIIWATLQAVRYGTTVSYSHVAHLIGRPGSYRAVANAIGRNPISIVIPCHRVIGLNGSMAGYAGGVDRKRKLLKLEKRG